jgi:hypothetical protein
MIKEKGISARIKREKRSSSLQSSGTNKSGEREDYSLLLLRTFCALSTFSNFDMVCSIFFFFFFFFFFSQTFRCAVCVFCAKSERALGIGFKTLNNFLREKEREKRETTQQTDRGR